MAAALKPFRIGELEIASPVILAALAGYSDLPYRLVCRRLGAPYCATVMMLDRLLLNRRGRQARMLATTAEDTPLAGQLAGSDPDTMAAAARVLCELGFDVVDLNFACPVHKALRRRRGGFLMKQPELAGRIVRSVVAASDRPVTVKIREKFLNDDPSDAGCEIAARCFDAGAAAVCAHPRSVEAKYAGRANWAFLAELRRRFGDRTVIGSGDVLAPTDALRMLSETGVDAVAVARGAIGNPWFFRQVRDLAEGRRPWRPTIGRQRELLMAHFAHACEFYGPARASRIMRKFGIQYASVHAAPSKVRMAFVEVKRPEDWQAVLDKLYTDDYGVADERLPAAVPSAIDREEPSK